jgi:hypothetical protein
LTSDISDSVRQVNRQPKEKLGSGILNEVSEDRRLTAQLGAIVFANITLSESEAVGQGESVVILLSSCVFFSYTGLTKVDDLRIKMENGEAASQSINLSKKNVLPLWFFRKISVRFVSIRGF